MTALELANEIHRKMLDLQKSVDEIQYLLYQQDERAKIRFFGGVNDTGTGEEGTKSLKEYVEGHTGG